MCLARLRFVFDVHSSFVGHGFRLVLIRVFRAYLPFVQPLVETGGFGSNLKFHEGSHGLIVVAHLYLFGRV
jgi:hypothetical protein